jgi:tetratricopeptide (TPR) repeat protein
MAFLKKVFSGPYRRALQLEAEGNLREAAEQFALASEHDKVVELRLRAAGLARDPRERLEWLRTALQHAEANPEAAARVPQAARALAEELATAARDRGLTTELDRRSLAEAAGLWRKAGDHERAGDALRELGRLEDAASAYKEVGAINKMEAVYAHEQSSRHKANALRDAWSTYQMGLAGGDRAAARAAVEECCNVSPENPEYREARSALLARWPKPGLLRARLGDKRINVVGAFPAKIGRDPDCAVGLRDQGISRVHAVVSTEGGGFYLADADSRNGTRLNGLPISGSLPLSGEGVFAVGDGVDIAFAVRRTGGAGQGAAVLNLAVVRGLDKGALFFMSAGEVSPRRSGGAADLPAAPLRFRVVEGNVWVEPLDAPLMLNGTKLAAGVLPLQGDRINAGPLLLEID